MAHAYVKKKLKSPKLIQNIRRFDFGPFHSQYRAKKSLNPEKNGKTAEISKNYELPDNILALQTTYSKGSSKIPAKETVGQPREVVEWRLFAAESGTEQQKVHRAKNKTI